ncbi:death on curing protein [Limimonas halophila]|uniref:Death on curing protein n=1 Tax=Limimonas halophila TaxID=1082479 RepID=A0A1G7S4B8_9PROT|nr:type II toxin-antitoxin system death-on-curing family toxin [Limimonas halophila]SDG17821.1 death on curing protein [Limimonas halophila]
MPVWLERALIDALHDRLLAEHGGSTGVRDEARLDAALARPRNMAAYGEADLCDMAAAYAAGIAGNHPFVDGNKRTAFMAAFVFLARNGLRLTAPEAEATRMMWALAAGDVSESGFAAWLRRNTEKTAA